MTGHTKGPWVIVPGDEWTLSVATIEPKPETMDGVNYWTVASCNGRRHEARANLALIAAAPDLLEALEAVEQEHDLLRWMKNIEMRRSQGSFGIAVSGDSDAIGWQEQAEKLKVLVSRREAAIARARGEA